MKKRVSKYYYQYRSSVTGGFVSKEYAERYPKTTQRIRRLRKP